MKKSLEFLVKNLFSKISKFSFLFLIILVLFIQIRSCRKLNEKQKLIENYKLELIKSDSLREESDGVNKRLVNNLNTEKELRDKLKNENKILYKNVRNSNSRILSLTSLVATLKSKRDTVYLDSSNVLEKEINFSSFYPKKDSWFIEYSGKYIFSNNSLISSWDFKELKIDLVLTEKTKGIWETSLIGPEFLSINSLKVNSLPEEKFNSVYSPKIRAKWGVGINTDFRSEFGKTDLKLMLGFEFGKNKQIVLEGITNKTVGIGLMFDF